MLSAGSLRIETFEGSRPDLAGQLLIGISIEIVPLKKIKLLHVGACVHDEGGLTSQFALPNIARVSVRRAARLRCVLGMLSSLEAKVLRPT